MSWQNSNGSRVLISNFRDNEIWPRNESFLQLMIQPEGEVENINPVIESIFSLLGQYTSKPSQKLFFNLHLRFDLVPGIIIVEDDNEDIDASYFSMDLPNLIEFWRWKYTNGCGHRQLDVLWHAESYRKQAIAKQELIKEQGWDILRLELAEKKEFGELAKCLPIPTVKLVMRRTELVEQLVAAERSPWSWRLGPT